MNLATLFPELVWHALIANFVTLCTADDEDAAAAVLQEICDLRLVSHGVCQFVDSAVSEPAVQQCIRAFLTKHELLVVKAGVDVTVPNLTFANVRVIVSGRCYNKACRLPLELGRSLLMRTDQCLKNSARLGECVHDRAWATDTAILIWNLLATFPNSKSNISSLDLEVLFWALPHIKKIYPDLAYPIRLCFMRGVVQL